MKKILFSAASALAIAGVAVAADSTDFGVLFVPSTAKETIVSVPWLASDTGSVAVAVADLVLTSGLEAKNDSYAGDELKYYTGSGYMVWYLEEDPTTHVKSWKGGTVVSDAKISETAGAANTPIYRGQAIILTRANPSAGFYIMGKPSNAAGSVPLNPGFTLVAPPFLTDTDPNSLTWSDNIDGQTDTILIPQDNGTFLSLGYKVRKTYKKWVKTTDGSDAGACIPVGKGFWFSNDGTAPKTVSWQAQ